MSKRTVIFTQDQINEIVGGELNSPYFDNSSVKNNGNLISTDGDSDAHVTTGDDVAHETNGCRRKWGAYWTMYEEDNKLLKNKRFDSANGDNGIGYNNLKVKMHRANKAAETMKTGATPEIKEKAATTLKKMDSNTNMGIKNLKTKYESEKNNTKSIRQQNQTTLPEPDKNNGQIKSIKKDNTIINFK